MQGTSAPALCLLADTHFPPPALVHSFSGDPCCLSWCCRCAGRHVRVKMALGSPAHPLKSISGTRGWHLRPLMPPWQQRWSLKTLFSLPRLASTGLQSPCKVRPGLLQEPAVAVQSLLLFSSFVSRVMASDATICYSGPRNAHMATTRIMAAHVPMSTYGHTLMRCPPTCLQACRPWCWAPSCWARRCPSVWWQYQVLRGPQSHGC